MPEVNFAEQITKQVQPKNPSAETVAAVLAQAHRTIFSMGSLLELPISERREIAKEAQPILDAIAKSPDPGKESFGQYAIQSDKFDALDNPSSSELAKQSILKEVIDGIRVAIGPKYVELGSPASR